ncbi:MAG TPA: hypothetical protein DD670_01555 [Planctomycetaceae bacterium]|nr:hypothetical protein [Planctomycetaceae bacterium]
MGTWSKQFRFIIAVCALLGADAAKAADAAPEKAAAQPKTVAAVPKTDNEADENPSPPARTTERPAYPLVIRMDHSALEPLEAREINHHGRIDTVVLGTHAVGESHTQGAISVLIIPDRDDASFDLSFQGRTHARTVGTNGPALIYSHTDTDFVCTRQISFDPRQGFVAVASTVVADTQLVYDGFGSSRGRLGHRLISRVAGRRAGECQEVARQIASRETEHKLLQGFDKLLNTQLTAMNQRINLARYVNLFMGEAAAMQLSARSSKDCIYVGVGHEGGPSRLTAIPPRRAAVAPIEIGIHSTMLGGQVAKLLSLFGNDMVLPQASRQEILRALSIPDEESARIIDVRVDHGWFVLGLQNETPASSPTATMPQATSDSTSE